MRCHPAAVIILIERLKRSNLQKQVILPLHLPAPRWVLFTAPLLSSTLQLSTPALLLKEGKQGETLQKIEIISISVSSLQRIKDCGRLGCGGRNSALKIDGLLTALTARYAELDQCEELCMAHGHLLPSRTGGEWL